MPTPALVTSIKAPSRLFGKSPVPPSLWWSREALPAPPIRGSRSQGLCPLQASNEFHSPPEVFPQIHTQWLPQPSVLAANSFSKACPEPFSNSFRSLRNLSIRTTVRLQAASHCHRSPSRQPFAVTIALPHCLWFAYAWGKTIGSHEPSLVSVR